MNVERWQTPLVVTLLVVVALGSWTLRMRPGFAVEADVLADLPLRIGGWSGRAIPMEGDVERMLDADYNVQRAYVHPAAGLVWLYIGYYGTDRGGRPEHTPWACYPSNGWAIEAHDVVRVGDDGREANELLVEQDGERRLVHFWYQSFRRTGLLGGLDQTLDRLANRILNGRADGSLVRLSTPLRDDESVEIARSRLIGFGRDVIPELAGHWPTEVEGEATR